VLQSVLLINDINSDDDDDDDDDDDIQGGPEKEDIALQVVNFVSC